MFKPDLATFLAWNEKDGQKTHMALSIELLADRETPISLYQKLCRDEADSFLLESAAGGENFGRYSFIGCRPIATFCQEQGKGVIQSGHHRSETSGDPLAALQKMLEAYRVVSIEDLPRFQGGAVGFLGYDCIRYFESVPLPEASGLDIPDAYFLLVEDLVIFDHLKHRVILVTHLPIEGDQGAREMAYKRGVQRLREMIARFETPLAPEPPFAPCGGPTIPFRSNLEQAQYEDGVRKAKEAIAAGEAFQIVFSQRLSISISLPPFELYRTLRGLNPSPYLFYLRFDGWAVVGASPEVLVRVEKGEVLLRPIAGTRPRGKNRAEDERFAEELLADEKELAEHRMLLDLGRNDVGRIASIGSVRVEAPLHLEYYSHVMHIVSDVRGDLSPDKTAFDVLRASFPAGTVSGAPKIRAMELISSLEPDRRSLYAGAVGYFDFTGNLDTCIAIRTMVVTRNAVHLQAGAGIVFDSDPASEYQESLNKARSGLTAVALTLERLGMTCGSC